MPRFPTAAAILILPLFNFTSVGDAAAQSQTDFMNAMDIVGSMQYCDVLQPGFKDATGVQYAAWRASHQASVAAVESLPQFKARPAVTEASVTPQQRAAYSKKCPRLQRYFTRVHPDPKFATPEKVWAEYLSSLRSGQPEAAMDCLVDSALENLSDIIETQSPDFLRRIATGYEPLRLRGGTADMATYIVTRNGQAGQATFSKIDGEWKISGAP